MAKEKKDKKTKGKSKTGKILSYFVESKEELKKVTWPTRKEAIRYTGLVLIISLIAALFLGFFDFFLSKGLDQFLN